MCICETWLYPDITNATFCPPSCKYKIERYDRSSRGGGVCLLINHMLNYRVVKIPEEFSDIEIVCIDVNISSTPTRVIGYYRPPNFAVATFYILFLVLMY